jgi:hypothetical protein
MCARKPLRKGKESSAILFTERAKERFRSVFSIGTREGEVARLNRVKRVPHGAEPVRHEE